MCRRLFQIFVALFVVPLTYVAVLALVMLRTLAAYYDALLLLTICANGGGIYEHWLDDCLSTPFAHNEALLSASRPSAIAALIAFPLELASGAYFTGIFCLKLFAKLPTELQWRAEQ